MEHMKNAPRGVFHMLSGVWYTHTMNTQTISTIEKVSLRVFLTMMILCALSALGAMWFDWGGVGFEFIPIIPTFFVVGFASFLIWLPIVVYKLIDALKGE
jgi:hypothetical protein